MKKRNFWYVKVFYGLITMLFCETHVINRWNLLSVADIWVIRERVTYDFYIRNNHLYFYITSHYKHMQILFMKNLLLCCDQMYLTFYQWHMLIIIWIYQMKSWNFILTNWFRFSQFPTGNNPTTNQMILNSIHPLSKIVEKLNSMRLCQVIPHPRAAIPSTWIEQPLSWCKSIFLRAVTLRG